MTTLNVGPKAVWSALNEQFRPAANYVPYAKSDAKLPANSGSGVEGTDWFDTPLRKIVILTTGNLAITVHGDDADDAASKVIIPVVAGQILVDFYVRRIWATGTTATFAAYR